MDLMVLNTLGFFLESFFVDHFSQLSFTIHHALDIFSMDLSATFQLLDLWPLSAIGSLCTLFRKISLALSLTCT